ncbi:hypothetical protein BASA61_010187 [Batrachochytrium salamandrivorans]|nr:hypothetical protein BASA61_010187 [Batrachochytrium salamandrivorans]
MFAVLNDDGPSLPKSILESRELQLEAALSQYLHGLEFQRQLDLVGARDVYKALLRLPIMKEPLAHVSDVQGSPLHALQFAVNKNIALVLINLGSSMDHDGCPLTYLQRSLDIDPSDFECNFALARLARNQPDFELAYRCLQRSADFAATLPQKLSALSMMAGMLFDLAEHRECQSVIDKIFEIDPTNRDAKKIQESIMLEYLECSSLTSRLDPVGDLTKLAWLDLERSKSSFHRHERNRPSPSARFDMKQTSRIIRLRSNILWHQFGSVLCQILHCCIGRTESSTFTSFFDSSGIDFTMPISSPWTIEFYDDDSEEKPSLVQMHIDDTKSCQTVVGNGSSTPQIQFAPTKRSRQENTRTSDRVRQKIEEASGKKGLSPNGLLILNPFLPAELKLDVDIVLVPENPETRCNIILPVIKQKIIQKIFAVENAPAQKSTNTPLPSVVAVLLKMSDHVPLETSPHFSDASIVSRFVKSLGQSATIQTIASRFIIDSVVGNDFLEKAIIYDFQWPMGFDSVIIRLLSLLEELGVHTHNLILYRPDISDDSDKTLEFLVILAEAIIDHCESQLSPSSASDPPEEYFGNDNSLLETTFTSILARLLGSIDSTPQRIFDLHPKILIRALWLKTRYIYATQSFSSASESLERLQEIVVSTFSKIVLECDSKSVRLSNSGAMRVITVGTVQSFMDLVSANQLIDNIQEHHRHLRHNKVVDLLVPILFPDLHLSGEYPEKLSDSICHAARHLISSCATTWSHLEYLECLQKAILELKRPHMLEHILPALLRHYLLTIISGEDTEDVITSKIPVRYRCIITRYIYMIGYTSVIISDESFSSASESLERLQEIVVSTFSKIVLECDSKSVRLSNSGAMRVITVGTVQSFMDLVSANQLIDNIQEHHRHLRHNKVVDLLVPILFPDLHLSGEYPEKLSDSICHAARHLISSCATTWSHLEYLECLQKAILELKRPHMLEHILPALLRHYLLTIISGEDTEDVITSKISIVLQALSIEMQDTIERLEHVPDSQDNQLSKIKYFQDNTTPLVLLMTKVAWQLMVSVSDDDSVSVLLKQSDDARNIIGNIVVRSWILLLSSSQLYNRVSNMDTKPRRTVSSTSQNGFTIKEIIKCTPEIISSEEDNDEDDSDDDSNDSAERDENDIHRETSFSRSDKRLVKMMSWIHDQLGDICLCGSAEGAYLRHVLGILTKLEYSKYYVYVNQCYACLYDVIIKLDRQTIYEHDCTPFKFEETAATEAFKLVSPYILDKLSKGMYRAITYDIRVCFEQIAGVLGDISLHNVHVQHNRNLINAYLESHIDPGVANPARKQMCGILPLECSSRIPDVFRSLFFVGGGIVWAQYNAKWANSFKGQEAYDELELAVVLLMKHVSIEPEDAGAWIILGQCQCALADELLNWSAIRIIESKKTIAQHQKKAFNSLLRASKLIQDPGRCSVPSADLRLALWKSLGHISCSIAGKPMAGESLLPNLYRIKEIWKSRSVDLAATNTDSEESASSNSVGRQLLHLMGVSIYSMQKALLIDPSDWRLHYSIAIAHVKLGNTSKAIKELFVATTLSAKENRSKEPDRVLEPLIKLMDVLALALYKKNISIPEVYTFFESLSLELARLGDGPLSTVFHTEDPTQASDPFQLISSALSVIKSMDKKKWQHKPIYRQAWILFNIRHDAAAAKLELLQLFQLRSNSISMKSIWKTEFERPGKFFVYIHKYALFLIKLAAATLDSVVLRQLYRRISKTEDVCLDRNHLLSEIRRAFCEMVAPTLPDNKKVLWTCKFVQQGDCRHVIERAENSIFADFNLEVESVAGRMLFAAELKREKVADLISLDTSLEHIIICLYTDLCWPIFHDYAVAENMTIDLDSDESLAATNSIEATVRRSVVLQRALLVAKQ